MTSPGCGTPSDSFAILVSAAKKVGCALIAVQSAAKFGLFAKGKLLGVGKVT